MQLQRRTEIAPLPRKNPPHREHSLTIRGNLYYSLSLSLIFRFYERHGEIAMGDKLNRAFECHCMCVTHCNQDVN